MQALSLIAWTWARRLGLSLACFPARQHIVSRPNATRSKALAPSTYHVPSPLFYALRLAAVHSANMEPLLKAERYNDNQSPTSSCEEEHAGLPAIRSRSFMTDEMDRSLVTYYFNGFDTKPSRYTAKADDVGDDVEKAWADLGIYYAHLYDITDKHVPLDKGYYFDRPYDGYPGKLQVHHFLHCVNMLRQGLWYNHDYYVRTRHPSYNPESQGELVELHVAHCIDQLRQYILCDADLRVVPFQRTGNETVLEFARPKLCYNYPEVMEFTKKHAYERSTVEDDQNQVGHDEPYFSWSGYD
ncbi:hypothetical protein EJ03DRAFT_362143 [Teratosphaeria nubilosa]|uniref:Tat pathway signal sequence n=1 Tax=Teratosphaeria nubilosa TaxID=161662 RepID=A0A6G1LA11_9PEZI|nr:hypothetical protein EJ03DRAFT_362143 [Teratosphaeria nubilosa]